MKPLHGNLNYVVALNVDREVLSAVSIIIFDLFDGLIVTTFEIEL